MQQIQDGALLVVLLLNTIKNLYKRFINAGSIMVSPRTRKQQITFYEEKISEIQIASTVLYRVRCDR